MLNTSLLTLLEIWQAQLKAWAAEGAISKSAGTALALEGEQPQLKELESAWAAGDFSGLPPVELLPATSMPGAAGAYAASTGTVYLNQDWFKTASEEQIQAVLTEELGHHLDAQFTEVDTPGDEGELFARQLLGEELSSEQQQAIQLQNDQIQILVDGQKINAEASQFSWPQQVGGPANINSNDIYALDDGSSLITGSFQGMARFGDKVLTSTTQDEEDIFVAKLNPDGSFAWVTQAGGSEDDGSNSITALSDGSSIITGYIEGTARFGNEIISKSNSSSDVFIGKLNPDGSFAWVVQAGGDESNINGRSISALSDGSLLLQGYFDGTAVFGDISITAENSDKGNVFIAKLNPDGGFAWATQGPPTSEFASSNNFATFADGSSLITGSFRGIQSFGDITLTSTEEGEEADDFSNDGFSDDIYVAKLSPNGEFVWASQSVGPGTEEARGISTSSDGSSIITGYFQSKNDTQAAGFGSTLLSYKGSFSQELFVAKLNTNGDWEWASQSFGSQENSGKDVSTLSDGSSLVTGYISGTTGFGSTDLIKEESGEENVVIAKLSPDGEFEWATQAGGSLSDYGKSITPLADGSSLIFGEFGDTASFGDVSLVSEGDLDLYEDARNGFIAKLNANGTWASSELGDEVSDTTAPTLISYELSSYNFDLSNGDVTIDVSAQITDDISGVFDGTYANGNGGSPSQARWRSPSGNQFLDAGYFSTPSTGNFLDGIYTDQTVLDANSEIGTWTLDYFLLADEASNLKSLNKDEVAALGIQTTFEVSGGISDTTAPTLISYELSSYNFDLSNGDVTIDVSAQITDDISGVFDGTYANGNGGSPSQARWRSPSGNQFLDAGYFSSPSTGNFLDGIYTDQTVLDANSETGTWTLDYFLLADEASNLKSLNKDEVAALGIQTTFEVSGGISDTTAPTLISYELSSYNFDLSNGDVTIDVSAQITDDISGVFDGTYANGNGGSPSQARWRSPSGNQFLDAGYFTSPSTGNFLDGIYTDQTVLDANSEIGTWTLDYFLLADEASNLKSLNKDEVAALGIQTTFEVSDGSKVDPTKSVIRGNSLYTIVDGPSWTEAEANAVKVGGNLVAINSIEEFNWGAQNVWSTSNYLANGRPSTYSLSFTGFNDSLEEGNYSWSSGEPMEWETPTDLILAQNWFDQQNSFESWDYGLVFLDTGWDAIGADQRFDYSDRGTIVLMDNEASFYRDTGANLSGIAETPFIRRGDSAYVIVEGPTWEEAEANANALGGHLVTVNDEEENRWIYDSFGIGKWIGLSDLEAEGTFKWSSGEELTYTNWAPGEPTNSGDNQDYVWIQYEPGLWDDLQNDPNVNLGIAEIQLAPNNTPTGTPTLSGDFKVGQTINLDASSISDVDNFEGWTPTYKYAWEVSTNNGITWSELTSSDATDGDDSYALTSAEVGKQLRGVVSYLDGYGTNEVVESGASLLIQPVDQGSGSAGVITSDGALQEGVTLIAPEVSGDPNGDVGVWADANPEYQWLKDGVAIAGATGSSYQVPVDAIAAAEEVADYSVEIVYTDGEGFRNTGNPISATAVSVAKIDNGDSGYQLQTNGGAISGAVAIGSVITAAQIANDVDGNLLNGSSVGYEWQVAAAGTQEWITVGTESTYTATTADSGKDLQLLIRYRDGQGYAETLAPLTAAVEAVDQGSGSAGVITADGGLQEGVTLIAPEVTGDPNGDVIDNHLVDIAFAVTVPDVVNNFDYVLNTNDIISDFENTLGVLECRWFVVNSLGEREQIPEFNSTSFAISAEQESRVQNEIDYLNYADGKYERRTVVSEILELPAISRNQLQTTRVQFPPRAFSNGANLSIKIDNAFVSATVQNGINSIVGQINSRFSYLKATVALDSSNTIIIRSLEPDRSFTVVSDNGLDIIIEGNSTDDDSVDIAFDVSIPDVANSFDYVVKANDIDGDSENVFSVLERRWFILNSLGEREQIPEFNSTSFVITAEQESRVQYEIDYLDGELNRRTVISEVLEFSSLAKSDSDVIYNNLVDIAFAVTVPDVVNNFDYVLNTNDIISDFENTLGVLERRWFVVNSLGEREQIPEFNSTSFAISAEQESRVQNEIDYLNYADGKYERRTVVSEILELPAISRNQLQTTRVQFPPRAFSNGANLSIKIDNAFVSATVQNGINSIVGQINSRFSYLKATVALDSSNTIIIRSLEPDRSFTVVSDNGLDIIIEGNSTDDDSVDIAFDVSIPDVANSFDYVVKANDIDGDSENVFSVLERRWFILNSLGEREQIPEFNSTSFVITAEQESRVQYEIDYLDGELNRRTVISEVLEFSSLAKSDSDVIYNNLVDIAFAVTVPDVVNNFDYVLNTNDIISDFENTLGVLERRWFVVNSLGEREQIPEFNSTSFAISAEQESRVQNEIDYLNYADGKYERRTVVSEILELPAISRNQLQTTRVQFPPRAFSNGANLSIKIDNAFVSATVQNGINSIVGQINSRFSYLKATVALDSSNTIIIRSLEPDRSFTVVSDNGLDIIIEGNSTDDDSVDIAFDVSIPDVANSFDYVVKANDIDGDSENVFSVLERRWFILNSLGEREQIPEFNSTSFVITAEQESRVQYEIDYLDGELNRRTVISEVLEFSSLAKSDSDVIYNNLVDIAFAVTVPDVVNNFDYVLNTNDIISDFENTLGVLERRWFVVNSLGEREQIPEFNSTSFAISAEQESRVQNEIDYLNYADGKYERRTVVSEILELPAISRNQLQTTRVQFPPRAFSNGANLSIKIDNAFVSATVQNGINSIVGQINSRFSYLKATVALDSSNTIIIRSLEPDRSFTVVSDNGLDIIIEGNSTDDDSVDIAFDVSIPDVANSFDYVVKANDIDGDSENVFSVLERRWFILNSLGEREQIPEFNSTSFVITAEQESRVQYEIDYLDGELNRRTVISEVLEFSSLAKSDSDVIYNNLVDIAFAVTVPDVVNNFDYVLNTNDIISDFENTLGVLERRWFVVNSLGEREQIPEFNSTSFAISAEQESRVQNEIDYLNYADGKYERRTVVSEILELPAISRNQLQTTRVQFPPRAFSNGANLSIKIDNAFVSATVQNGINSIVGQINSRFSYLKATVALDSSNTIIIRSLEPDRSFTVVSDNGLDIIIEGNSTDDDSVDIAFDVSIPDVANSFDYVVKANDIDGDSENVFSVLERRWFILNSLGEREQIPEFNSTSFVITAEQESRVQYEIDYLDGELNRRTVISEVLEFSSLARINDANPEYQWLKNGVAIAGATDSTYLVPFDAIAAAEDLADYRVEIVYTDGEGFRNSDSPVRSSAAEVEKIDNGDAGYQLQTNGGPISGAVAIGTVITAAQIANDVDGNLLNGSSVGYEWQVAAAGTQAWVTVGTESTYTATTADSGKDLQLLISYRDGQGYAETLAPLTAAVETVDQGQGVAILLPENGNDEGVTLIAPEVTGDPNGDVAVWADANPEYQWLKNGVAIAGATGSTYLVPFDAIAAAEDLADYRVEIVYTDGEGFRNSDSPVRSSAAEVEKIDNGDAGYQLQTNGGPISGAVAIGTVITAAQIANDVDGNLLNGSSVGYEWQVAAAGTQAWVTVGTESTYTATTADSGKDLQLLISYRDGQGYAETLAPLTAAVETVDQGQGVAILLPENGNDEGVTLIAPEVTGDPNGDVAVWADANPEYQWLKNGVAIAGATGSTYLVPFDAISASEDLADYRVEIVYTDGEGFRNSDSPVRSSAAEVEKIDNGDAGYQLQTNGEAISGAVAIGTVITAAQIANDVDGNLLNGSSVGYEWQVAAAGTQAWVTVGTESTYKATTADSGKDLQLLISYRDGQGYAETLAPLTAAVETVDQGQGVAILLPENGNDEGVTLIAPEVTGDPNGDVAVWADANPEYQWLKNGVAIAGATGSTYLVPFDAIAAAEDLADYRVEIVYTDGEGFRNSDSPVRSSAAEVEKIDNGDAGYQLQTNGGPISGAVAIGTVITAAQIANDVDGNLLNGSSVGYEWQVAAAGTQAWVTVGTESTYTATTADSGKDLQLLISYRDGQGYAETLAPITAMVQQIAPPQEVVLFLEDFETADAFSDQWNLNPANGWQRSSRRKKDGHWSGELNGRVNDGSMTSKVIDLTGVSSAELSFDWRNQSNLDSGEFVALDLSSDQGQTWQEGVAILRGNVDPENKWVNETIDLSQWSGGTLQLRFRGTMNKGKERSNVDHVLITGLTSGPQPVLPELAITNANPPNQEDATGMLLFEVTRSGDLNSSSSATWMITGTGTNPANADDFVSPLSGEVTFAAGVNSQMIAITVAADPLFEQDETFQVTLSDAENASITTSSADATILNDDTLPVFNIVAVNGSQSEDVGTPLTFSVTRNGDPNQSSSVQWSVSGEGANPASQDDFMGAGFPGGLLSFDAGETSKIINVDVLADSEDESDEGFLVALSNPVNGSIATDSVTGLIINDDVASPPQDVVLFSEDFENADVFSDQWNLNPANGWQRSSRRAKGSSWSGELNGRVNDGSMTSKVIDLTGVSSAELSFVWRNQRNVDTGEFVALDLSNDQGQTWEEGVATLRGNVDPENIWIQESIDLSDWVGGEVQARFRGSMSASKERANVDDILITGSLIQESDSLFSNTMGLIG